ncbi:unnamed protein product, partial [Pylaiella littoralis]
GSTSSDSEDLAISRTPPAHGTRKSQRSSPRRFVEEEGYLTVRAGATAGLVQDLGLGSSRRGPMREGGKDRPVEMISSQESSVSGKAGGHSPSSSSGDEGGYQKKKGPVVKQEEE